MPVVAAPGYGTYALFTNLTDDIPHNQIQPGTSGTITDGPDCKVRVPVLAGTVFLNPL